MKLLDLQNPPVCMLLYNMQCSLKLTHRQMSSPSMASCSSLLLNETRPPTAEPMMKTSHVSRISAIFTSTFGVLMFEIISWYDEAACSGRGVSLNS